MKFLFRFLLGVFWLGSVGCEGQSINTTPSTILSNAATLVGSSVTVVGKATGGVMSCLLIACPEDDPCCGGCLGLVGIVDQNAEDSSQEIKLKPAEGVEGSFTCSDDCGVTSCTPLTFGSVYSVTGTLLQNDGGDSNLSKGDYYISVESYQTQ